MVTPLPILGSIGQMALEENLAFLADLDGLDIGLTVSTSKPLGVGYAFIKGEWAFFGAFAASFYLPGLKKESTCLFQLVQITRRTQHGPSKRRFRYARKLVNHIFN